MNAPRGGERRRLLVATSGALLGPVAVYTIYMVVGHVLLPRGSPSLDYLFATLSIATGLGFLWRLPLGRSTRIVLTITYLPIAFGGLVMYALAFACRMYRACL